MLHGPEGAQRASENRVSGPCVVRDHRRFQGQRSDSHAVLRVAVGVIVPIALILASSATLAQDTSPDTGLGSQVDRSLKPGDVVTDHGITIVVPDPGTSVWGELKFRDGTSQSLMVETDTLGRVTLFQVGDEAAPNAADDLITGVAQAATGTDPKAMVAEVNKAAKARKRDCSDTYRNLYSWRMPRLAWRLNAKGAPKSLLDADGGTTGIAAALTRAQVNVTAAHNDCGRKDHVSAKGSFLGYTRNTANVSVGRGCSKGDHKSVISFGDLPRYSVAMTCVYQQRKHVAREADIRINNVDALWALRGPGCGGRHLLLEAAITHEFGHAYGLAHASSYAHPTLTMQPIIPFCSLAPTTLGAGDLKGLEAKY